MPSLASANQVSTLNVRPSSPAPPAERAPPPPATAPSMAEAFDRSLHAAVARWTGGLSPAALALAFADWQLHLAASPAKRFALVREAIDDTMRFADVSTHWASGFRPWSLVSPAPADHRFAEPDWESPPYNLLAQAFLLQEKWWHSAASDVRGLAKPNAAVTDFTLRQLLDAVAPSNFPFLNPEVLRKIMETGGGNFVSGLHNWLEDWNALLTSGQGAPASGFTV